MQNIFVYGTLKRGQEWAWALAGQEFLLEVSTTPEYWMFNLGTYPGLVDADAPAGDRISGEVYRVDAKCRAVLDEVECVDSGLYELREIQVEATSDGDCPSGPVLDPVLDPVFAYFYLGPVKGCKRLQSWQ